MLGLFGRNECDVVVPRNRIAEHVKYLNAMERKYGIKTMTFGMQEMETFMSIYVRMA